MHLEKIKPLNTSLSVQADQTAFKMLPILIENILANNVPGPVPMALGWLELFSPNPIINKNCCGSKMWGITNAEAFGKLVAVSKDRFLVGEEEWGAKMALGMSPLYLL